LLDHGTTCHNIHKTSNHPDNGSGYVYVIKGKKYDQSN
jgi:hypothetical protein